jgi:hypothetical protein
VKSLRRFALLATPTLAAATLGAAVAWRSEPPSTSPQEEARDPAALVAPLAGLAVPGAPRLEPLLVPADRSPEALQRHVAERVSLVPYEGALAAPADALVARVANDLDRARLLAALLAAAGHEARVVVLPARTPGVVVEHAAASHASRTSFAPALRADLEERVAALAPVAWERLRTERAWLAGADRSRASGVVAWTQVRRAGAWVDLLFPDTSIPPQARRLATPLDDATLASLTWTVTLRLTLRWVDGASTDALSFTSSAAELHARAITVVNLPAPSLARFVPTLLVGDRRVDGAPFELGPDRELAAQLLEIETRGPGRTRRSTRVLVGPRGAANDVERGLEVAALARIVVLTGPLGDEAHADAIGRGLAWAAARLRGDDDAAWLAAPPLRALTLLRASRALAGHVGDAARRTLAYQDRPAVAIERAWVAATPAGLRRRRGLDLVDPGHAFRGPDAGRAAVEQGVLDGALEQLAVSDLGGVTSQAQLEALLPTGAFDAGRPDGSAWSDEVDGAPPRYRLQACSTGLVGWRLDPGPQLVPILADGTGGAAAIDAEAARLGTAAEAVAWGSMLVPGQVLPFAPLMAGLVGYDLQLARTYRRAASALDGVAARIAGDPDDGGLDEALRELALDLDALGPTLASSLAEALVADAAAAVVFSPALARSLGEVVEPLVRQTARERRAATASRALSFRQIAETARELRRAGFSREEVRRFFEELGCFPAGALVLTPSGPRPIETLREGDLVRSRDPLTGAQGDRRVLRVHRGTTTRLCRITIAPTGLWTRPRQVGRTALHARPSAGDADDAEPPAAIVCTPNHPVWRAGRGFVAAALLKPGDRVLAETGELLVVEAVAWWDQSAPTWNLEVEGWHTYFVAGHVSAPAVWVHNAGCGGRQVELFPSRPPPNTVPQFHESDMLLRRSSGGLWEVVNPAGEAMTARGRFVFTTLESGEMRVLRASHPTGGHGSLASDAAVRYAGEVRFDNGRVKWWDNASGHYRPTPERAWQSGLPEDRFRTWQESFRRRRGGS